MDSAILLTESEPRRLVLVLYEHAQRGWPFLSTLVDRTFREAQAPPEARGIVAETVADMVRWRRTVATALGAEPTDGAAVLAGTLAWLGRAPANERLETFRASLAGLTDPVQRVALGASFPDWLAALLVHEVGAERAIRLGAALNDPPPQTLRVNTLKTDRDGVLSPWTGLRVAARPTQRSPVGVSLEQRGDVFALPAYREGLVEPQDEASQLVTLLVAPPPGSTVVDACAGAGGKTLGLGALLNNRGRIIAMDTHTGRLEELRRRAKRAGLHNVRPVEVTTDGPLPAEFQGVAARVLVDAPCSGLGALRRNPEARWRLQPADLERLAAQQLAIATRALGAVAPRGRLVYATCSFARAEGEDVVERILAGQPGLERVSVREVLGRAMTDGISDDDGMTMRTWPDRHGMDGFFAAVLRRRKDA